MSEEAGSLRRKFEELEEEVKRLREPLESTLMDVRELISNLENPFNYATSVLNLDGSREKAGSEEKLWEDSSAKEDSSGDFNVEDFSRLELGKRSSGGRSLSILLCAYPVSYTHLTLPTN